MQLWVLIADHLHFVSKGQLDTRRIAYNEPAQSRQSNLQDCGPFALCTARWLIEGWPLNTLEAPDMRILRRRMAVELERWSFK